MITYQGLFVDACVCVCVCVYVEVYPVKWSRSRDWEHGRSQEEQKDFISFCNFRNTKCPSVMYSQVLKYELNGIYHFIEAMHA